MADRYDPADHPQHPDILERAYPLARWGGATFQFVALAGGFLLERPDEVRTAVWIGLGGAAFYLLALRFVMRIRRRRIYRERQEQRTHNP